MEVKLSIEENQFEFFMNLIEKLHGVVKNYEILEKDNLNTPNDDVATLIKTKNYFYSLSDIGLTHHALNGNAFIPIRI